MIAPEKMTIFPHNSAPIYDDQESGILPTRQILGAVVGAGNPQRDTPWMQHPEDLVDWLEKDQEAAPFLSVLDLHDRHVEDLEKFGLKTIGTEAGELTGWRTAQHVIVPRMLDGSIRYRIPLIFVSGQARPLARAQDEARPLICDWRAQGIQLEFLSKPARQDDVDGKALRRLVLKLARDRIIGDGLLGEPLFELGLAAADFDHLSCIGALQSLWGLTDNDMSTILKLENPSDYRDFKSGKATPLTKHWKHHVEKLYGLKSRLSGLMAHASFEDRQEYDQIWLRTPRDSLADRSPLDILLDGDVARLDLLIAFIEGIEINREVWMAVPISSHRIRQQN